MKYYIFKNGIKKEVCKSTYFSLKKKLDCWDTIHTNNGVKIARSIKL